MLRRRGREGERREREREREREWGVCVRVFLCFANGGSASEIGALTIPEGIGAIAIFALCWVRALRAFTMAFLQVGNLFVGFLLV
jgi:hypothetical protein